MGERALICVSCGSTYPPTERFCPDCHLPLSYPEPSRPEGEAGVSERRRRARKVKPQLTEGELVRVAGGRNQAEAEFIQALLLEEGVPSVLRRTAGFDVPDYLAAGPRDVLVPAAAVATAREVLLEAELVPAGANAPGMSPPRLLAALLVALALGALVIWLVAKAAG